MHGPQLLFHPARVAAASDETPLLRSMVLEVSPEVRASYRIAGQFVEVRLPGASTAAFFAVANAPGNGALELLIKRGQGLSDELAELEAGAWVETTLAMGKGFPVLESRGRDMLLFATGSGFAPIRASLQEILRARSEYGAIDLFYGVRSQVEFPYLDEFATYEEQGVRVHRVVSKRTENDLAYAGYVQEKFREALPPVKNAVAFLCGQAGMIRGVREALAEAGLPADRIHLNL